MILKIRRKYRCTGQNFPHNPTPDQRFALETIADFLLSTAPDSLLLLKGYAGKVKYAQFLHDRSELRFGKANASVTHKDELDEKDILLVLPDVRPDVEIPVIELILN